MSASGVAFKSIPAQEAFLWYRMHVVMTTGKFLDPWGCAIPNYGCPTGTGRQLKIGTNEEALGHMWYRTINAPRDGVLTEGDRQILLQSEPKLKSRNTFLAFEIRSEDSAPRRRASSDGDIVYSNHRSQQETCASEGEICDSETLSTGATDSRSRTASEISMSDFGACESTPEFSKLSEKSGPPGVFAPSQAAAATVTTEDGSCALAAMKAALGCQVPQLAIAALRAEVEALDRKGGRQGDRRSGERDRISKSFSMAVASRLAEQSSSDESQRTTISFRRLPVTLTRSKLIATLNGEGFRGKFDFVYLPVYFGSGLAFSYAFVNCTTSGDAVAMTEHFNGFTSWRGTAPKEDKVELCEAVWTSPFQGFLQHVERYRNSPVMHSSVPDDHKPVIFSNEGLRIPFPVPTRKIPAPRVRKTKVGLTQRLSSIESSGADTPLADTRRA